MPELALQLAVGVQLVEDLAILGQLVVPVLLVHLAAFGLALGRDNRRRLCQGFLCFRAEFLNKIQ